MSAVSVPVSVQVLKEINPKKNIGLIFNVRNTHKWLSSYFDRHNDKEYINAMLIQKNKSDGNQKLTLKTKLSNSHYALTCIEEVLCISFLTLVSQKTKKNKAGMYNITEDQMIDCINSSPDFKYTFGNSIETYNTNYNYSCELLLKKENIDKLFSFHNSDTNTVLEHSAYNFLMFILLQNRILLANSSYQMMMYAKKLSIDYRAIMIAINIFYKEKSILYVSIKKKLEELSRLIKDKKDNKKDVDVDIDKNADADADVDADVNEEEGSDSNE